MALVYVNEDQTATPLLKSHKNITYHGKSVLILSTSEGSPDRLTQKSQKLWLVDTNTINISLILLDN